MPRKTKAMIEAELAAEQQELQVMNEADAQPSKETAEEKKT